MTETSLMSNLTSRIRTTLNIHTGESRMVLLVIGVMLLTSAGFTLGSTGDRKSVV